MGVGCVGLKNKEIKKKTRPLDPISQFFVVAYLRPNKMSKFFLYLKRAMYLLAIVRLGRQSKRKKKKEGEKNTSLQSSIYIYIYIN